MNLQNISQCKRDLVISHNRINIILKLDEQTFKKKKYENCPKILSLNTYLSINKLFLQFVKLYRQKMDNNASPYRSIKNSTFNYHSNTSQQYQQQFWKLKAQRYQSTIQQLKKQNHALNKRLIEMSRIEQELRQKIVNSQDDWKNRSRRLTTERISERFSDAYSQDKPTQTAQIQRLYKQIRILKNVHQVQLSKLQEQNKKLKKTISEAGSTNNYEKQNAQQLKIISNLNEEITQIKKKLANSQENITRLREEKGKIIVDNQGLRKQIQDIKLKEKLAQKEEQEKFLNYKQHFEDYNQLQASKKTQRISRVPEQKQSQEQSLSEIDQRDNQNEINFEEGNENVLKEEIEKLKKQISLFQKKQKQTQQKIKFQSSNIQNQRLSHQVNIKKLEGELIQAKNQLSHVLNKLAPLLEKKKELSHSKENIDTKASLSILEIFLKKYKIQAF